MQKKRAGKKSLIARLGLFDQYNVSFILTSLIPLGILVYVFVEFLYPALAQSGSSQLIPWLNLLIIFLVFLAILGFFVSRAATRETVNQLENYNDQLKNLFDISGSLSQQSHLDVLLESLIKSAIEMTDASAGLILMRDDADTTRLRFEVSIGTGAITEREIPADRGVAGWVATHGESVLINDLESDPRYESGFNILPNFDTSAILAVPLKVGESVFGTMELLHRNRISSFSDEDRTITHILAGQASIYIENVKFRENQQNYFIHITEILLSALEETRQFWKDHNKNTARYSNLLGRKLHLNETDLRDLHYASLLHDIGFVQINLREGNPRKMVELHPEIGYKMIAPINLWRHLAPIIRHHHERYDGAGYPMKLKGEEIPFLSRVLAVAEALDSLTNRHSYRPEKLDFRQACKEIAAYSGTQFDPRVVTALEELMLENAL